MNASKGRVALKFYAERDSLAAIYAAKKAKGRAKDKSQSAQDTSIYASPPWTDKEDAYVIKFYPTDGAKKVGIALGRTPRAAQTRASHLGVTGPKILLRASA